MATDRPRGTFRRLSDSVAWGHRHPSVGSPGISVKRTVGILVLLIGVSAITTAEVHPIVGIWEVTMIRTFIPGPGGDVIPIDTTLTDEGLRVQLGFFSNGRFQTRIQEEGTPWEVSRPEPYTVDREAQTATVVYAAYYEGPNGIRHVRTSSLFIEHEFPRAGRAVFTVVFVGADGERDPYPEIYFVERASG